MRGQAQEIERLRMELQRTSIKQKESIPELTPGALDKFVQEERVAPWMRLCVGPLKEFLEHANLPLQRPLNHEGANEQGAPPSCDHVLAYRISEVLCKSQMAYMTRYNARSGQEPKGRSPYASLEEARGALPLQRPPRYPRSWPTSAHTLCGSQPATIGRPKHQDRWVRPWSPACTNATRSSGRSAYPPPPPRAALTWPPSPAPAGS